MSDVAREPAPVGVVIVGAAAAGVSVVEELRRGGYDRPITLIGAEAHAPYDRPPLSKQVLTGAWGTDRISLSGPERLAGLDVCLRTKVSAQSLDLTTHSVLTTAGSIRADQIVIATGCTPRQLPGEGAVVLRTIEDALTLRDQLTPGRRVLVVGAGFLGMEVAAVATELGAQVTVIAGDAPMVRSVGPAVSARIEREHSARGVRFIRDRVTRVAPGRVSLRDGADVSADLVVAAIGAEPATGWLAGSGLTLADGIVVDAQLRAAPGVFAAGDVARFPDPRTGELTRHEHRMNATETAVVVAANIIAGDDALRTHTGIPFWWSDQYDLRIQAYGVLGPQEHRWHGDIDTASGVVLLADGDEVTGAVAVNAAKQLRAARALLVDRVPLSQTFIR